MCALNISNYFWSIFYYYDHKRRTNFEQKSSLQPGIRNWKSVYWNLDFFLTTSSVVGGGDFGAIILECDEGLFLQVQLPGAFLPPTSSDFGESSSWSLKHGWRSSEFFSGLQSTYQSSWNKSYDIWIKIRHVIKDW